MTSGASKLRRPLRQSLATLRSSRATARALLAQTRLRLHVRAFSDAAQSTTNWHDQPLNGVGNKHSVVSVNGSNWIEKDNAIKNASASTSFLEGSELLENDHALQDIDFTAQRIGFPVFDSQEDQYGDTEIREEARKDAIFKAERILAVLRHSMTELDIGKVVHRVAQYATLPRVTSLSRKQFLRSLETRFGPNHTKEFEFLLAFLHGRDEVMDQLELESRKVVSAVDEEDEDVAESSSEHSNELVVPEIMGLHPDLVADPKFIGVVFCYCRLACLNSLKLVQRPSPGHQRSTKSSLWQVKNDFRKVLDMEGFSHFAEMMGLEKQPPTTMGYDVDAVDAEWEEFNLENDRIDFRMLVAQTQELIEYMKQELPNETISKMLIAMLASVKTSKLHRKIFQEMVCNIQTAFPEQYHEPVLSKLVPFLSGNNATYADFNSELASTALQHHRLRHEAILRALLEARMRVGHILIHDIDDVDPAHSISTKLSPELREKVITTAWNIVSVLDDRQYHMFFSRFLKYKLAWRPSRTTFGQTFLDDARKTIGPRCADAIMPLFEETYHHLSVETLTICRVKMRHAQKLLRERAQLEALNDQGTERLSTAWQPQQSVFYRNLPHGVTEKHLRDSLEHIGPIKRFFFFSTTINGAPDDEEKEGAAYSSDDDDEEFDDLDGEFGDDGSTKKKKKKKRSGNIKELRTPRKKTNVIASDRKTGYHVLVEFGSEHARDRALQRALQIFGVMMAGWKEYRPVFSSSAEDRTSISIQNIPFGTRVGDLLDQINAVLATEGLKMNVSASVPRGVLITNGRLELRFASFTEAAQTVDLLHQYVRRMKSRRAPRGDDAYLATARAKRKEKYRKALNKAKRAKKQSQVSPEEEFMDEEVLDDEFPDEEEDEQEEENGAGKDGFDEDEEEYFAADIEEEEALTEEERVLLEVLRPFDVTFNAPPSAWNKHLYV